MIIMLKTANSNNHSNVNLFVCAGRILRRGLLGTTSVGTAAWDHLGTSTTQGVHGINTVSSSHTRKFLRQTLQAPPIYGV